MKISLTTIVVAVLVSILILLVGSAILQRVSGVDLFSAIREKIESIQPKENVAPAESIPLEVSLSSSEIETYDSSTAIVVISNQDINLSENSRLELVYIEDKDNQKFYVLKISNVGVGVAPISFAVASKSGETKDFIVTVTRQDYALPFGMKEVQDWEGSTYTIDGNDVLAQVDKTHKLVDDYTPKDLVDLNTEKLLYTNSAGIRLRSEAADNLALMLNDLQKTTGKIVVIASGYRTINDQFKQYISWITDLGQEQADKVSARPGYSEHSLGTVVDFMSQDSGFTFTNEFDSTVAGKWLNENSYKYGYVQSYPKGKEAITGYNYEAWHYRYIGVENAIDLKESNLTLKEWLENK